MVLQARSACAEACSPYWGVTEMGLEIGDLWVAASGAEKQHYQRVAKADKASYKQVGLVRGLLH